MFDTIMHIQSNSKYSGEIAERTLISADSLNKQLGELNVKIEQFLNSVSSS